MKIITVSLKGIYKAKQCTDLNDVTFAISSLKSISKGCYNGDYTPAMRKRLNSLEKRKEEIILTSNKLK